MTKIKQQSNLEYLKALLIKTRAEYNDRFICATCHNVFNGAYKNKFEFYLFNETEKDLSYGICEDCILKWIRINLTQKNMLENIKTSQEIICETFGNLIIHNGLQMEYERYFCNKCDKYITTIPFEEHLFYVYKNSFYMGICDKCMEILDFDANNYHVVSIETQSHQGSNLIKVPFDDIFDNYKEHYFDNVLLKKNEINEPKKCSHKWNFTMGTDQGIHCMKCELSFNISAETVVKRLDLDNV